ncbi:MAG: excinuclease ABC subunit UvrA [Patescibacteria group bacterium]
MSPKPSKSKPLSKIDKHDVLKIRGARVHNLKNLSIDIPKNKFVVITGLSGSGKSSLAFDTIFAEGQRRYMESLSSYASQFLELQDKPDVDSIDGLSPTIAIDQKSSSHNPRSTVGTVTEIYDLLRVLFARAGVPHCPKCGVRVAEQTPEQMGKMILNLLADTAVQLFAPVIREQKGEHKHTLLSIEQAGYKQVRYDGVLMDLEEAIAMRKDKTRQHSIDVMMREITQGEKIDASVLITLLKKVLELGNGFALVVREDTADELLLSQSFSCPSCKINLPIPEPRLFSFNNPAGACAECTGLGIKLVLESNLVIPNQRLTFAEGAIKPWTRIAGNQSSYLRLLETVGKIHGFSIHTPVEKLKKDKLKVVLEGTGEEIYFIDGQDVLFPGILKQLETKYRETDSEYVHKELESYMRTLTCPSCGGKRLRPEVLAITIAGRSVADVVDVSIEQLADFFSDLVASESLTSEQRLIIERIMQEAKTRVQHLLDVGLGYLTLDRAAMTLSGGESQRVRLATSLASKLSGVIYILDEPSIGLHPRDNDHLINMVRRLRDAGNSVFVVEHDKAMIEAADHVIDIGPGAGIYGGELVAQGTPAEIRKTKESLTGQYLSGKKAIDIPKKTRKGNGKQLTIVGASAFNLKQIDVTIPLGKLVCVTGVSGSGKSTLILDILGKALAKHFYRAKAYPGTHKTIKGMEYIDKVVAVDQSPIGRTPRSNPATYTGVFTVIRDLYTGTPEAKMRAFDAGKFSFNVKGGGRCEVCAGEGQRRIEMQFLPDVYVDCPECHGKRYNAEALEIHYKGKNIADVLETTVEEARRFFADQPLIYEKLNVLHEVGLGYITLGQPAVTLSGGEAQRVKLATELSRRATGKTLYILDEPTTGLHFEDISRLLQVIHQLVDKGNTVLIIEHNLDVIKGADWIIDMGPGGGDSGGQIVAEGTPKDLIKNKRSVTGCYLHNTDL